MRRDERIIRKSDIEKRTEESGTRQDEVEE